MVFERQSQGGARPAAAAAPTDATTMRVVGALAITLAVSMGLQNVMFGVTEPPGYGTPIDEVFTWHAQNRVVVAIAVAQEGLHIALLLGFLAGLHNLVGARGGVGAVWSRLAVAAGATLSGIYALYSVMWIGTVLAVGELTEPSPTFELAWQLHAAAFALALPALGATFIGAAVAAYTSRLTPKWQLLLGVVAGGSLLAAGVVSLEIADGSALLFAGLPGFFAWIVWLLVTGVRLVRARPLVRPNSASPTRKNNR